MAPRGRISNSKGGMLARGRFGLYSSQWTNFKSLHIVHLNGRPIYTSIRMISDQLFTKYMQL